jgi:hypothetical protein
MTDKKSKKPEITDDMGPQAMFEAAFWGVTEQGCQATDSVGKCVYMASSLGGHRPELRCALGHAMTTEQARNLVMNNIGGMSQYTPDSSYDDGVFDPDGHGYTWMPRQVARNMALCLDMQDAHDSVTDHGDDAGFVGEYHDKMRAVSLKHALVMPEVGAA